MIKKTVQLFTLISLFAACKTVPVLPTKAPVANVDLAGLAKEISAQQPTITNLRARIRATYDDQKNRQQVILQLRMNNQKSIWMSATMLVPIAKLLLKPNEVAFYEKFQKRYFEGDYALINSLFDTDFGYDDIKNLLLGNPLLDPSKGRWQQISNPDYYLLMPKLTKSNLRPVFFFDPESFLLKEQRVVLPGSSKTLSIKYLDHQRVQGKNFPLSVEISFFDGKKLTKLLLEYTRVDLPSNLNTPFDIPKGYKKIEI